MKFSKIVYLRLAPFSEFIHNALLIDELTENNISIDYLDLSPLHFNNFDKDPNSSFENIIVIDSIKTFKSYIKNQDPKTTLFINVNQFTIQSFWIYYYIGKYKFKFAALGRYGKQVINYKTNIKQKLNGFWPKLNKRIITYFALLLKELNLFKVYDYIIAGGNNALISASLEGKFYNPDRRKAEVIKVNSFDYEKFSLLKTTDRLVDEPYYVFIDQYLPYHPDFKFRKVKTLEPESYYNSLNKAFEKLERLYKVKVVIAAHPKAEKYNQINPFNGRRIFFNSTAGLVTHCDLVLLHTSTSVNFAVLYNKPMVVLSSPSFETVMPVETLHMNEMSKALNCSLIDFESDESQHIKVEIDKEKYQEYKYNYMTFPESENRKTIDILVNFLDGKY